MRKIFGIFLIILGVVVGLYISVWLCLIGGILGLIHDGVALYNHDPFSYWNVTWNILKLFFGDTIGGFVAFITISAGMFNLK